ncbi:hypothetical protein KEM48_013969 [Puccinia striiformis f. sp. tritici PST-130]|nr:hypothetical protein KEM48_013969 [Puccinia striiformis f. sp. tritici PST-130]
MKEWWLDRVRAANISSYLFFEGGHRIQTTICVLDPSGLESLQFSKLKILDLVDKDTAEVLMDRWLVIRMIVPMTSPDAFVARSDLFLHIYSKPWFAQVKELSQQGNGVVIMDRPHGMRDLRKAEFYNLANVTLVPAPYAYELFEYRSEFATQTLLVHQPHFIDKKIFYHPVADTRPEDIITAGDLGAGCILSIRSKIGRYDPKTDLTRLDTWPSRIRRYQIGRKICLVTDSRWANLVQEYAEAAAARCMIAGNVPLDRQKTFEKVIVLLSNKDSDEKIIKTLEWWLTHDQERNSKAQADQDWILNSFSMDRYAEDVWKMVWQDQIDKLQLVVINVDDNCSILWMVPCLTLGSVLARFLKAPAGVFEAVGPEHHSRTNFWNSKARS